MKIFSAASGSDVQTLTPAPSHDHTDVAWDNAGNLYLCDNADSIWRAFSPPGANTNTTVAMQRLEVSEPPLAPVLNGCLTATASFASRSGDEPILIT